MGMENNELLEMVRSKAQSWLTKSYDAETKAQVQALLDNEDPTDLIESFYKDLEFGTGGLRGIMGVGTNRMNIYTVGAATQGLSNYLKKNFQDLTRSKSLSAMTAATTAASLPKSRQISSLLTVSKYTCLKIFARLRKCLLPSVNWDARVVLS